MSWRVTYSLQSCKLWSFIQRNFMIYMLLTKCMIRRSWKNHEGSCWHFMLSIMAKLMRMLQPLRLQCAHETQRTSQIRKHPLPLALLLMAQPQEPLQTQVRDAIRAAIPKAAPRPLDPERMMSFDSRDPRADPNQWPCHGSHTHR